MSDAAPRRAGMLRRIPESVGAGAMGGLATLHGAVAYVGGLCWLAVAVADRVARTAARRGRRARAAAVLGQAYRFGVRSVAIVTMVQVFIGLILVLNLAPTLQSYGQLERVADVVAIAMLRELGPLITAVLLSGFAGASVAAELGTMVEGEEIKAMRAHALDPIQFLVMPRVLATAFVMVALTVIADVCGVLGGLATATFVLDVDPAVYLDLTRNAVRVSDYLTGLFKGLVFGAMIAVLACYEGLNVRGGAEGVGLATTVTVVKSIVGLILLDSVFTACFYVLGW